MLFRKLYEPVTTACIESTSPYDPSPNGYARTLVRSASGRPHVVGHHRVVYAEYHKLTLEDMKHLVVMHKCDNRKCINPEHLMLGSVALNNQDKVQKGRNVTHFTAGNQFQRLGTGNTRLTEDQVKAIRADKRRQVDIAKSYNITQAAVSGIKLRKLWKDLD